MIEGWKGGLVGCDDEGLIGVVRGWLVGLVERGWIRVERVRHVMRGCVMS